MVLQPGLCRTWSETPKTGFLRTRLILLYKFLIFYIFCHILTYISLSDDYHVKICKFTALSSDSFCQIYRVTDEALIAETAVWPNFFLMNVFFALKGSKLFIIISYYCSWMLCRVSAVQSLPTLIYSADHILLLAL